MIPSCMASCLRTSQVSRIRGDVIAGVYPGDGRAKPELRGLQSTVGERRQAEDAIGNESDSNDDDDDHAPRFGCGPAQCAIDTGGLRGVGAKRGSREKDPDQRKADTAADLADRA